MRRTQKFLSVFLAIMMVISIVPITASAAPDPYSGVCGDNLTWSFDETTGTLTISGEGGMDDYGYYSRPWEDFKDKIENVVIDNGVTTVGHCAFSDCINIESVTITESVNTIGEYAFSNCESLAKAVLPEGVTEIGDGAFSHCYYLDTVVIPGSVEAFGEDVFASCERLANVTLCDGLTDIGLDTFDDCTSLTDIIIPEGVESIRGGNFSGCYNLKNITIPASVTGVGNSTFTDCSLLTNVYYTGTEEDWNNIDDLGNNAPLFDATIHYNSTVHTHSYVKVGEVATTCDEDGYTTYTCECGHSYKGDYVKETGHSYDNGVVTTKPTCDVDGVKTFTCATCSGTYTEAVTHSGHSYDDGVVTKDPTCTVEGVKTFTCATCGDTYTEAVDKIKEHDYQLVENTSPETTGCIKTYKCTICGDTYSETVSTSGHTQVVIPEFAPTETKPGLTAGIVCSGCSAILLEQEIIPALGTTEDSSVIVSGTCGTNATWTYNTETGALIISGTGAISNYKSAQTRPWEKYEGDIKSIVINNGITKIGNYAFDNFGSLIYVSISDSVTEIGSNVFRYCTNLRSVVIPDRVNTLNYSAFEGCKNLIYVTLSNSISYIQDTTFKGCSSLTHVTIPDSVYYVNASAFSGCTSLKSVTIGKNVGTIYNNAFNGCTALTDIYYVGTEEQWNKITIYDTSAPLASATIHYNSTGNTGGTVHNHKYTVVSLDPTCTEMGYTLYTCECGYKYEKIYDALGHNIVATPAVLPTTTTYGCTYSEHCSSCGEVTVEGVIVPILNETSYTTKSGDYLISVFDDSTDTLTVYGTGTIEYGHKLNSFYYEPLNQNVSYLVDTLIITEGITGIGNEAFKYSSFKAIKIADSVTYIGKEAFCENDQIRSVWVGDGVKTIGNSAFANCYNLNEFIIGKSVESIGTNAFQYCEELEGFIVDSENQYFSVDENGILYNGDKTELILCPQGSKVAYYEMPLSVKKMRAGAFFKCPYIAYVKICDGVTTIPVDAFYRCENLNTVVIPASVTTVGEGAFEYWCTLSNVYYGGTEEQWAAITVKSDNERLKLAKIYFNYRDYESYSGSCGENLTWTYNADTATLTISGTGVMTDFGYENDFPWYSYAKNIKKVIINDGVTSISNFAFCGFSGLETVEFADSVTTIGEYCFENCDSLKSITLPDSVTSIGDGVFRECMNLSSVKLSKGLTAISSSAFAYCINLVNITIPDNIEIIGSAAFCGCKSLENITLSKNLTAINGGTFAECYSLKAIDIPDSVTIIYRYAFDYCVELETVKIGKGVKTIQERSFYNCDVLNNVYYAGSEESWNEIDIGLFNGCLVNNDIHFLGFTGIKDNHFYKNDEMQKAYQLVEFEGNFYFIGDRHEIVKNRKVYLSSERINGLTYADGTPITVGYYDFDENGKMVIREGVVGNNIYKNNTQLKAYQLVEVDGDFYFIGDRHQIVKNKRVYLSEERINGLTYDDGTPIAPGYYMFDIEGKMAIFNGVIDGYVYKNNTQLKAYQLVDVYGEFYFIGDRHQVVKNKRIYLSEERINGLTYADGTPIAPGYYDFDEYGRMIILDGIVGNNIYKNNVQLKAYQLVEVDGDFYFIGDRHEIVKDKKIYLNEERINGLSLADGTPITVGYYNVDADGKLIINN